MARTISVAQWCSITVEADWNRSGKEVGSGSALGTGDSIVDGARDERLSLNLRCRVWARSIQWRSIVV